jgi:ribose transport system substrate-binding protein
MSAELNMNVVAVTEAGQDPNKQRKDIETTLALNPDIIITLVLDPVSGSVHEAGGGQRRESGADQQPAQANSPMEKTMRIVTDDLFPNGQECS